MSPATRGRTVTMLVRRYGGDSPQRRPDQLIVEEPMEIRLDDHVVTTTMRTPGHDFELAVGFCFSDGLLAGALQYWLYSRQPCGDPRCQDCMPISTAEGRMGITVILMPVRSGGPRLPQAAGLSPPRAPPG